MNKEDFLEFLKTFLITAVLIFIAVLTLTFYVQQSVFNEETQKKLQDDHIDISLIDIMIEKNKYLAQQKPDDYKINLKLGALYDLKGDFNQSIYQYQQAISKAPYNEYKPQYKLALAYIRSGEYDDAEKVMNGIEEKPQRRLVEYKADVFKKLGDAYYGKANYQDAIIKYLKALTYYRILKSNKIKDVKNSLASSYVYMADQKINNLEINDAIEALETAYNIVDAPIIRYKLAILYSKSNPDLAQQYYNFVFKKEPSLINYDDYYQFLYDLADGEQNKGNIGAAGLYRYRIKKLKDYYSSNILSVQDIIVADAKGSIKRNFWHNKYLIDVSFKFKNVSNYDMNSLCVEIVFKDGTKIVDNYSKNIVDKQFALKKQSESPVIHIKTVIESTEDNPQIQVQILASKAENGYKLLLKELTIENNDQPAKQSFWTKLFYRILRFSYS